MLPNKILSLSQEEKDFLLPPLDGPCYEFAIAFQQVTGWPIIGLIISGIIRHVGVRNPNGIIYDARGPLDSAQEFARPFIQGDDTFTLRENLTPQELALSRGPYGNRISQSDVRIFFMIIPVIWTNIPVVESHPMKRFQFFAEGLRELSEKHGVCVRGQVPTSPIHFAIAEGDEQYVISPTADGLGWTLQRDIIP